MSEDLTNPENSLCRDHRDRLVKEAVIETKMNLLLKLGVLSLGMLGYSVLFQGPSIKAEVAKEIARLEKQDQRIQGEIDIVRADLGSVKRRVDTVESVIFRK